jgi:outer membrane protein assembly factor BamB
MADIGRRRVALCTVLIPAVLLYLPAPTSADPSPGLLWHEVQRTTSAIVGAADFDGDGAQELLVTSPPGRQFGGVYAGGFYVAEADGSMLWNFPFAGGTKALVSDDLTGDALPDVVAQFGGGKDRVAVLSGLTGEIVWSDVGAPAPGARPLVGDLDHDGARDLIVPMLPEGSNEIELAAFFGPGFARQWSIPTGAQWITGDALSVANLDKDAALEVVVGTRDEGRAGRVLVLDGRSGEEQWTVMTGEVLAAQPLGTSVVALVWSTVGLDGGQGARRAELVGYSPSDGGPMWRRPLAAHLPNALSVAGDVDGDGTPEMVVGTEQQQQSLNPAAGTIIHAVGADGRIRWASHVRRAVSDLALVPRRGGGADVAYGTDSFNEPYGQNDSDEEVGLLSGGAGARLWTHEHRSETSVGVDGEGVLALRYADFDGDGSGEVVYSTSEHRLISLAATDGTEKSQRTYPGGLWTAAGAGDSDGDGSIDVVGGGHRLVRAMTEDGQTRWSTAVPGVVGGVRVQLGNILTVQRRQAAPPHQDVVEPKSGVVVVSLDPTDGTPRWSTDTGIVDFDCYGTNQHAFGDLNDDGVDDVVVGGPSNLPHRPGRSPGVVAVDGATGQILWRYDTPPTAPPVSIAVGGGRVFVHVRDTVTGNTDGHAFVLLSGASGKRLWEVHQPGEPGWYSKALVLDDMVVLGLVNGWANHGYRTVTARRLSDGAELWREELDAPAVLVPAGSGGVIAVGVSANELSAVAFGRQGVVAEASRPWFRQVSTARPMSAAAVLPGGGIMVASARRALVFDPAGLVGQQRLIVTDEFDIAPGTPEKVDGIGLGFGEIVTAETETGSYAVGLPGWHALNGKPGGFIEQGIIDSDGVWVARIPGT